MVMVPPPMLGRSLVAARPCLMPSAVKLFFSMALLIISNVS